MPKIALLILVWLLACVGTVPAATVLFSPMDSLEGWSVRSVGASTVGTVEKAPGTRCAELIARRGTVLLTRDLPLDAVRGSRLMLACMVKTDEVARGPQAASTAKIHLAVQTPTGVRHQSVHFTGTSDWHREGITADVPADARRVVLNLGLESCAGRVRFERLVVQNDRRGAWPLDLSPALNASHQQLGLAALPQGTVQWQEIPFKIVDPSEHDEADCLRLSGEGHADWPRATVSRIPVGRHATTVYILHAVLTGGDKSEMPCAIWTAWFAGGQDAGLSVFEGRDVGAIGRTKDLENWKVAWRQQDASGKWITFGVTKWTIYGEAPLVGLSCRSYRGASPVVLAVTAVEEPPRPQVQGAPGDDEWNIEE